MGKMPQALQERPEISEWVRHIWSAYIDLDKSRQYGYGHPQPLLTSEIEAYARLHHYSRDDVEALVKQVRKLDSQYFDHLEKKQKEKGKKRGKP